MSGKMRLRSNKGEVMTDEMHGAFKQFCGAPLEELSEEEWALLQVHMVYCLFCRESFEKTRQTRLD